MSRPAAVPYQTIILAAGLGARLGRAVSGVPKPLVTVAGVPLIAHALTHAENCGCLEAIVVVGHQGAQVRRAVQEIAPGIDVRFVENPDPATPNGVSLLAAEHMARDLFFLQMVDHLFGEPVLDRLPATAFERGVAGRVLVDRDPVGLDIADATKVRLDAGLVSAIGKAVDPWHAIDAGCFVLTRRVFDALRAVPITESRTVSSAMRQLAAQRSLGAVDVGGVRWLDVDTPAGRDDAERMMTACSLSTLANQASSRP